MELLTSLYDDHKFMFTAAGGAVLSGVFYVIFLKKPRVRRDFPANVVGLHVYARGPHAPSMSSYALKLENYLRMAKIPYEVDFSPAFSSKGKTPWITYNGQDVDDSQFCIEFLNDKFNVDLNKHLSNEEKAIARAFQKMVEENLYWAGALLRYYFNKDPTAVKEGFKWSALMYWMVGRKMKRDSTGQGIGRHTEDEVRHIGELDIQALSTFMGKKKFLMGDEPCEADAAIFGLFAQLKWHSDGAPYNTLIMEQYINLSGYCDRMKARFWPDWDDCTTRGGTQEPKR